MRRFGSWTWARRMWACSEMTGKPAGVSCSKSGSSCSVRPVSGAPVSRRRPMVNSLATRSAASQVSSSARMRRRTRVVPPWSQLGPSLTHTARSKSGVPGWGLTVPSSWPMRLRWVSPAVWVRGLRRKPRCVQRARVKDRASLMIIRRAWVRVRASSAQICSSRSAPVHSFLELVDRERREGAIDAGRRSGTSAAAKSPGPNPKVTVSRAGSTASSGSVSASAGRPAVSRPGVVGEQPHHPHHRLPVGAREQVEADEDRVGLRRRRDARLVEAVEGLHRQAVADIRRDPGGAAVAAVRRIGRRRSPAGQTVARRRTRRGRRPRRRRPHASSPRGSAGALASAVAHAGLVVLLGAGEVLADRGERHLPAVCEGEGEGDPAPGFTSSVTPISMMWSPPG